MVYRNLATPSQNIYQVDLPVRNASQRTLFDSSVTLNNIAEGLDIRYTGIKDWVFYAAGEWSQANENRTTSTPSKSIQTATDLNFNGDNYNLTQKYSLGANWYPLAQLNFALQYYVQTQNINQSIASDDNTILTERVGTTAASVSVPGNQRLLSQTWVTNDVNFRATWRPLSNLTLVSRYDFQRTQINSQWQQTGYVAPFADPNNPGTNVFAPGESGLMTSNIISECLTWNPMDRLYFQGNISYVLNSTTSPAATLTPSVLNSNNNYITASAGVGYAIDNKTNVRADCSFYNANDYINNSKYGVPYGAGATEYDFTLSLNRQITRNVGVSLKYFFNKYSDVLSGGNNSYTAQVITSSLQVQF